MPGIVSEKAPHSICGWVPKGGVGPCGAMATWHLMWNLQGQTVLCCDEHLVEAKKWVYLDVHPYVFGVCAPGSRWLVNSGICEPPPEVIADRS